MKRILAGITVLVCISGSIVRSASAQPDQSAGALPDVLAKASQEAFELLTAPRAKPADIIIKIAGDQHQWSYTYTNPLGPTFKSSSFTATGQPETNSDVVVPQGKSVELLVTSNDNVYELAMQGLGVSLVAVPGRLQSLRLMTKKVGRVIASCSSDCDANGRADTIAIRVVSPADFEAWLRSKLDHKP